MADFYKVLKADPLGEPWTPNKPGAKPIQNYWCQVEGQDWAVNIGRQTDNPLLPGMHVYGDLTYAKSQKGTEYWKFKWQKVPEDVPRPTDDPSTPAQAQAQQATGMVGGDVPGWFIPFANQLEYIYQQMKKMDTDDINVDVDAPIEIEEPGAIDEETQATLETIFGETEVPEEK
jgi:hypothetical protein